MTRRNLLVPGAALLFAASVAAAAEIYTEAADRHSRGAGNQFVAFTLDGGLPGAVRISYDVLDTTDVQSLLIQRAGGLVLPLDADTRLGLVLIGVLLLGLGLRRLRAASRGRGAVLLLAAALGVLPGAEAGGGWTTLAQITVLEDGTYLDVPPEPGVHSYRMGAVTPDGTFYTPPESLEPAPIQVTATAERIDASRRSSVGLTADNKVWTWGTSEFGLLGNGTQRAGFPYEADATTPIPVSALDGQDLIAVAAGADHNLALGSDGRVWAWGRNLDGQIGDPDAPAEGSNVVLLPVLVLGPQGQGNLQDIVAIAAGEKHSLALDSAGRVYGWGRNDHSQAGGAAGASKLVPVEVDLSVLPAGVTIKDLAAGDVHTLALASNGTVWAWGQNTRGQIGVGEPIFETYAAPVQVLLDGGRGILAGIVAIAAAGHHSLALAADGTVWAWGQNDDGRLGDGTTTRRPAAVAVDLSPLPAGVKVTAIAAGQVNSYAVAEDGSLWAWGGDVEGQLGNGPPAGSSSVPVQVAGLSDVVEAGGGITGCFGAQCSAGTFHAVALDGSGRFWAWGRNDRGHLGDGTSTNRDAPVAVTGPSGTLPVAVETGSSGGSPRSFARFDNGQIWGWGRGRIALGTGREGMVPARLADLAGIVPRAVASDFGHTLVLAEDGTAWAWGSNGNGQLGDGNAPQDSNTPVQVDFSALPEGVRIVDVEAAGNSSYALADDGTVWAWGNHDAGQLGNGTWAAPIGSDVPAAVVGLDGVGLLTGIVQISASVDASDFVLALDAAGHVWTWGDCSLHTGHVCLELCTAANNPCNTDPRPVCGPDQTLHECIKEESRLSGVAAVSAGNRASVALLENGTLWTWGRHDRGQLGNGTCTPSGGAEVPVPVAAVQGLGSAVAIDAGRDHVLALLQDGTVWGWGDNELAQLGNPPRTTNCGTAETVPLRVGGLDGVTISSLASGAGYGLGLDSLGQIWSWGANVNGELGTQARDLCFPGPCSFTARQIGLLPR
jgi:alpha-tubulin suppressor-like RCC1 family protein